MAATQNSPNPTTEDAIIASARKFLAPNEKLSVFFVSPTKVHKDFVSKLKPKERAAFENAARAGK